MFKTSSTSVHICWGFDRILLILFTPLLQTRVANTHNVIKLVYLPGEREVLVLFNVHMDVKLM